MFDKNEIPKVEGFLWASFSSYKGIAAKLLRPL